jgi:hypothetical protein
LTADILCMHHNRSTNELDEAGGRFARAIEDIDRTDRDRRWAPSLSWAPRVFEVDGPLLERWFLKTLINMAVGQPLPIGMGGTPSRPTVELVEMVYGRRPVASPRGLFCVARVGNEHSFGEGFQSILIDQHKRYLVGGLLAFRTMVFGFNFEDTWIPSQLFDRLPSLRGSSVIHPFRELKFEKTNVSLRLRW